MFTFSLYAKNFVTVVSFEPQQSTPFLLLYYSNRRMVLFTQSAAYSFFFFDTHTQSYGGYQSGHGGGYSGWGGGGGYEDRMSNLGGGLKNVDWSSTKLEHFEKNFYIEDKRVSARTEREIEEFKRSKEIKVRADYMDQLPLRSHLCFIFTLGSRP